MGSDIYLLLLSPGNLWCKLSLYDVSGQSVISGGRPILLRFHGTKRGGHSATLDKESLVFSGFSSGMSVQLPLAVTEYTH